MKKISLIILAVTLSIASCKNYDDDFKALNASIAELQTQVAGFSSLQAGLTALQTSVASLQTTVSAIPTTSTTVDLSGLEADLATSLANIASLQADLNTVVANYSTSTDLAAAQADIDALTAALATAQTSLDELLTSNNVYDGTLTINSAASLAFAESLGAKVAIVNGDVLVTLGSLDAAAVSAVTSQIMSATGSVTIVTDESLDFSALTSVGAAYSVTGGADILDAALTNVGTTVELDYDGGYTQPNLVSAGAITLTDWATSTTVPTAGTLAVDFSGLTSGTINAGTLSFLVATSIKLNYVSAGAVSVTAPLALTVDMLAANYKAGLTVAAVKAGSVITIAGRVDDGATTPAGAALSVSGSATSTLVAASLPRVAALNVTGIATALSFPALTVSAAVTAPATVSFSAPLLVASAVTTAAAKTISLASTPALTAAVVETLTFSALTSPYTADDTLVTANVTGKVAGAGTFTAGTAAVALETVVFGGELDAVSLTGNSATTDALTSVTTSGAIDAFSLINNGAITSITLGHSHITGGSGSVLVIDNNNLLESLTTSTDKLLTLTVTDNDELAAMDFASYTSVIAAGTIAVDITGNLLEGTYTNAVAAGANAYVETVITSADLVTLKPFVTAFVAATTGTSTTSTATMTIVANFGPATDNVLIGTATTGNTLTYAQTNDAAYIAENGAWGTYGVLDTVDEFLLIQ
jgi:hypothetical protein